jgi:hypothetical protein
MWPPLEDGLSQRFGLVVSEFSDELTIATLRFADVVAAATLDQLQSSHPDLQKPFQKSERRI